MNIYIVMYPVLVTGNDQLFAKHQYLCTDDMQQQKNNYYNVVNTVPNINKNLPLVVVHRLCKK